MSLPQTKATSPSPTETPPGQPPRRKLALALGALMCGLVLWWSEAFEHWTLRKALPGTLIALGLLAIVPRVGAFLSWLVRQKRL